MTAIIIRIVSFIEDALCSTIKCSMCLLVYLVYPYKKLILILSRLRNFGTNVCLFIFIHSLFSDLKDIKCILLLTSIIQVSFHMCVNT